MNIEQEIELMVRYYLEIAVEFFQLNLKEIPILYDIPDKSNAVAYFQYTDGINAEDCVFRCNRRWAEKNKEVYLKEVIPHEVAHYLDRTIYGTAHIEDHGQTWKLIMTHIFGLEARTSY